MTDRPGSPTQQVSEWLSRFAAAREREDCAAAVGLFGDECYWRDSVSLTWNIKTLEGKGVSLVLDHLEGYRGELRTLMTETFHLIAKEDVPVQYRQAA